VLISGTTGSTIIGKGVRAGELGSTIGVVDSITSSWIISEISSLIIYLMYKKLLNIYIYLFLMISISKIL
jgi:hypothetical protein